MSNTTLNGITLHDGANAVIIDNDCRKESILAILPLYLSDSDLTDVFDFGGVIKTITLTGSYVGANVAALKTWIDSMEALQQGHQDIDAGAPYAFVDDLRAPSPGLKVKVLEFSSPWNAAEPTRVTWTIKLVQSSTNA